MLATALIPPPPPPPPPAAAVGLMECSLLVDFETSLCFGCCGQGSSDSVCSRRGGVFPGFSGVEARGGEWRREEGEGRGTSSVSSTSGHLSS